MSTKVVKEARFDYKYRANMTTEQMTDMFNDFAKDYDQEAIVEHGNMTALVMAEYLTKYYTSIQRSTLKVLDVAAGTGHLGLQLKSAGFVHLDALDPAEKMLEVAKSKDVYQNYFCEYMDGRRIPGINTDTYDLLTVSDGFNIGLIPLKAFTEIVRVVKPEGLVVFAIADQQEELGYRGEFSPLLSRLVEDGVWEKIVHRHLEEGKVSYQGSGPGTLFAVRIKVSEMIHGIM